MLTRPVGSSSERLHSGSHRDSFFLFSRGGGAEEESEPGRAADPCEGRTVKTEPMKDEGGETDGLRISDRQKKQQHEYDQDMRPLREKGGQSEGEGRHRGVRRGGSLTAVVETEALTHAGRLKMSAHAISIRASCRFIELDSGIWQVCFY